jgi:nicotinamidase-related amidase
VVTGSEKLTVPINKTYYKLNPVSLHLKSIDMNKIIISLFIILSLSITLSAQEKTKEPIKPALLVIDIQNKFLPWMDEKDREMGMMYIKGYIEEFRKLGLPIIRIHHSDPKEGPFPGTPEFEFPDDIGISKDDAMIVKTYGNSFTKTDLDKILKEKGANTLFLCGLSSVGCVLATYIGAQDHDYKVFLLKDAIFSHNAEYTGQIETIFDAIGWEVVELLIE